MGAFSGLREAKMFERGTPLTAKKVGPNPAYTKDKPEGDSNEPCLWAESTFDLEIEKCLLKKTRKSGMGFIVEMRVTGTSPDPVAHPVGAKRSWFQKMEDADVAFGAIKQFAAAVSGVNPNDKEAVKRDVEPHVEDLMDKACDEGVNALKGSKVRCTVLHKRTQKNFEFSQHNFEPATAG